MKIVLNLMEFPKIWPNWTHSPFSQPVTIVWRAFQKGFASTFFLYSDFYFTVPLIESNQNFGIAIQLERFEIQRISSSSSLLGYNENG